MFVISAPSGTGKTTITNRLRQTGAVSVSVSHTTRPPRPGEQHGVQYFFTGREEFLEMRAAGVFLEWAEVFGNYYGTKARWVREQLAAGVNILLEIDVQGAGKVKAEMPAQSVLIFIRPPSLESLAARLQKRGQDSPEVVARRLAAAESEMNSAGGYDYVIINDNLERAVDEIRAIIKQPPKTQKEKTHVQNHH